MTNTQSDDTLMSLIGKADMNAFRELFGRHGGHVLGYAQRYLKSREKAEDITQDVWMKVIRLAASYKGEGHFVAWIYTLVRNACLNDLRSDRRLAVSDTVGTEIEGAAADLPLSISVEDEILKKENWQELKHCIDTLPETQRVSLLLYAVEGLSYEDIAQELNTSVSAVKSLIFRARGHIAKTMKNEKPSVSVRSSR